MSKNSDPFKIPFPTKYQASLDVYIEESPLNIGRYFYNFDIFEVSEFKKNLEEHFETKSCNLPVICTGTVRERGKTCFSFGTSYPLCDSDVRQHIIDLFVKFTKDCELFKESKCNE